MRACAIWDVMHVMVQEGMHAEFEPVMLQSIWSPWVCGDAVQLVTGTVDVSVCHMM